MKSFQKMCYKAEMMKFEILINPAVSVFQTCHCDGEVDM